MMEFLALTPHVLVTRETADLVAEVIFAQR